MWKAYLDPILPILGKTHVQRHSGWPVHVKDYGFIGTYAKLARKPKYTILEQKLAPQSK